ncbi:hypothetical protein SNE40_000677 [Patella caerulea]|uniref:Uncharacterized protein n=1 Tax=Patella caerulea TaxID=87958 RepID=A0AAN8KHL5_PATCE
MAAPRRKQALTENEIQYMLAASGSSSDSDDSIGDIDDNVDDNSSGSEFKFGEIDDSSSTDSDSDIHNTDVPDNNNSLQLNLNADIYNILFYYAFYN